MSNVSNQIRASSSLIKRFKQRMTNPAALVQSKSFTTLEGHRPTIVHKRSLDILHDPWFNKGTAFSMTERDRLDLRGLLPPNVMSSEQQIQRFMADLKRLQVQARDGPSDPNALAKWRILNRLHDRNETMYFKVLIANIEEYAPIVYTPTVGLACQNYSGLFRRPRGMYFSAEDRGEMMSMVYNWPAEQVDMIVVTDGSRILGLGDLGVQGIGITIGKLDLYVAAAGINPQRSKWAFKLLQRYRNAYRMFNDDVQQMLVDPNSKVQGTAGVAIAGLLGAVRAQGRPMIDFPKQKIVVAGAGSAGIGVLNAARKTMARMLGNNESAFESAGRQFWVVDAKGLITEQRENIDPQALPFARKVKEASHQGLWEGASLAEVVREVKPDVLLGLSAVGGLFSKEEMVILATATRETTCISFQVLDWGLYFLGLGSSLMACYRLQLNDGNYSLAAYMTEEEVLKGIIYPSTSRIRDITKEVAAAVVKEAIEEDLAEGYREMDARELRKLSQEEIEGICQEQHVESRLPNIGL
uniref:Malic enzyme n=1 Tax=Salix viminalis TaxID=40686 RepID=A0A6N2MKM5_SALVM